MSDDLVLRGDAADERLIETVATPDYINPEPRGKVNLLVIGGGPAGLVAAAGAAGLGAKVALAERRLLGGDCLNFGCVPSKAMLASARAAGLVARGESFGLHVGESGCDFEAVMARVRAVRARLAPHDGLTRFLEMGIKVHLGTARFRGPDEADVDGKPIRFHRALIATGAAPVLPDIPGLADAGALTNESLYTLTELPRRLAIIGAGPMGCEMAQAFARFGSEVVVIESADAVLRDDDSEAAAVVRQALEEDGVTVMLGARIERVTREGDLTRIHIQHGEAAKTVACDTLLAAAGRRPVTGGLGLENAGVDFDPAIGIETDDRLRTANPRIYAAGDCTARGGHTHVADAQARIVIRNALFRGRERWSGGAVPACTYTDPELAHVGLSREAAGERGATTLTLPFDQVDRAVLDGNSEGFARVHLDPGGRVLGATCVGRGAGDLIAVPTLLMSQDMQLAALNDTILPYPTRAAVWKQLADQERRTRLTPGRAKLLRWWLKALIGGDRRRPGTGIEV